MPLSALGVDFGLVEKPLGKGSDSDNGHARLFNHNVVATQPAQLRKLVFKRLHRVYDQKVSDHECVRAYVRAIERIEVEQDVQLALNACGVVEQHDPGVESHVVRARIPSAASKKLGALLDHTFPADQINVATRDKSAFELKLIAEDHKRLAANEHCAFLLEHGLKKVKDSRRFSRV
jgi:hypothetical protein